MAGTAEAVGAGNLAVVKVDLLVLLDTSHLRHLHGGSRKVACHCCCCSLTRPTSSRPLLWGSTVHSWYTSIQTIAKSQV